VMQYYGVSRYWLVDRAAVTTSAAILCLAKKYGINILPSAPYRHTTIGRLERWHATVGDVLATPAATEPKICDRKSNVLHVHFLCYGTRFGTLLFLLCSRA